jgi:HlyD family secretion protein
MEAAPQRRRDCMVSRFRRAGSGRRWYVYVIAVVAVVIVILGIEQLGTKSSSARVEEETVTAENGVVQSTVSGTGEVEPGVEEDVNFGTSGTLKTLDVKVGQWVKKGQLLATLDPTTAKLTLAEAKLSLKEAETELTEAKDGETSSTSSSTGSDGSDDDSTTSSDSETADDTAIAARAEFVADTVTMPTTTTTSTTSSTDTNTSTTSTQKPATKKSVTKSTKSTKTADRKSSSSTSGGTDTTATTTTAATTTSTVSASTVAADKLQVEQDKETVKSDEQAVKNTKLYAPVAGEIASLADTGVGESVSSGTNSAASSDSTSSSSESSTGTTAGSSASSTSSSEFAEIVNSHTMTMTVELTEANISSVKVGQVATVDMSALSGVELAGKVTAISPLGTSDEDVVEYDATITIDQQNSKVLPGMSASATIVTDQASGVTVPTEALSGTGASATVKLVGSDGKTTSKTVVVALRGSTRAVIAAGLKSGQQLQITETLPSLGTSTTSSSSSSSGSLSSTFGSGAGSYRRLAGGASGSGFSGAGAP